MIHPQAEALDHLSRDALLRFRLEAFDNVDVTRLLDERTLLPEQAEWIARHLLKHSRGIEAYRGGQQILTLLRTADVA